MAYTPNVQSSYKITKTYLDFQAAALTSSLTLYVPQGTEYIAGVVMAFTVPFAGTAIATLTINLQFGSSAIIAPTNALAGSINANTGVSGANFSSIMTNAYGTSISASTTATAVGANLSSLTQGSVDFYILLGTLPV